MPFGPADTISKSLSEILASKPPGESGGFVIFENEDGDYVQFGLEREGLSLFWSEVSRIEANRVVALLRSLSFAEEESGEVMGLREKSYVAADDGVYAQFGRDTALVETFTMRAFRELFGREPQNLEAEIER